ncbi:MAG TPA: type II toxin-antitoxin system PemK/MazF family toxin [Cyclobacteriaceae bacterium]|nr:type II toxin-antitoxin system PemK/MazF family toxin [Cyclobacteriaceae bacterium]
MKQGEIWYADLNPIKRGEQSGLRPVLIVSGNLLNEYLPVIIAMPLTTRIKKYKGNPIISPTKSNCLKKESEVLVFHIRSISKERLVNKIGVVDKHAVETATKTLNDILKY